MGTQTAAKLSVATRKRSLAMSVVNLFLFSALLICGWEVVLYLGSHYYNMYHGNSLTQFNVTAYEDKLLQSSEITKELDASQNITTALKTRVDSLSSAVGVLKRYSRKHEQSGEQLIQNQRNLDENFQQIKGEILNAVESVRNRLHVLENTSSISEGISEFTDRTRKLEERIHALEGKSSKLDESGSRLRQSVSSYLGASVEFRPLKDMSKSLEDMDNGAHAFISQLVGRGRTEGPPEIFSIPSNLTGGRLLCLRGNDSTNGTRNSYAFAFKEGLPPNALLLPGTTLISETYWDFSNPWHAMYNLVQFVHWKTNPPCRSTQRLLLYHWSELRTELGYWIKNVFEAASLPSEPEKLSYDNRPVCFDEAVVSRSGIGGVPSPMLRTIFQEVRCTARRKCGVSQHHIRSGPTKERKVRITLMARSGARMFANLKEWEGVVKAECRADKGCSWSTVFVSNLTFCQQVQVMSKTDILVTVHGAQLTNMVFMSPGSRILEMFPRGWEEFAGHGQFIYSNLASWVGLHHDGYWRDSQTPECPKPSEPDQCFGFYKDQPVGMNATHVASWLARAIDSFNLSQEQAMPPEDHRNNTQYEYMWDQATCACPI